MGSIARRRQREIHPPERASLGGKTKSHPRKLGFPTDEPKGRETSNREVGVTDGAKPKPESVPTQCERGEMGEGEAEEEGRRRCLPARLLRPRGFDSGLPPRERGKEDCGEAEWGRGFCRFRGDEAGARKA